MTTAVLIHGFSGSPASWRRVQALLDAPAVAPAVGGHGAKAGAVSFGAEIDRLAAGIREVARPPRIVVGYSLGGRLALGLLVRHPDLFRGGALIGANPGIGCETERAVRRQADERWARLIEERGLAAFDREWSALPLFRSQRGLDDAALLEQRGIRLGHDPNRLAAAMRAFSLGAMPDYRPALPGVGCPVDLIAGGLDAKFAALARKMAEKVPEASVRIIDGAGHNVPLEAPEELARLLNAALSGRAARAPAPGSPPVPGRC